MVNINEAPYFDRFNPEVPHSKVLFRGDRKLQASELNEMQSITENSIAEIGNALMRDGNIQEGLDYSIEGDTITVHEGRVYLAGKVRRFSTQTVPFVKTGRYELGVRLLQEVITSRDDSSLLDQTIGAPSYHSEGADRLKETVELVGGEVANSAPIYIFEEGELFNQKGNPELEKINDILAERTYDESGSYRVDGLDIYTEPHPTDDSKLNLVVDSGKAYVMGYRILKTSTTRVTINKALGKRSVQNEGFYYKTTTKRGKLGNRPISSVSRVTGQVKVLKEVVGRGVTADSSDFLRSTSVIEVTKVYTDAKTYVQGVDYQLSNGQSIDWSLAGTEPGAGTSYYVDYIYNKALQVNTDYKLTIEGQGDNRVWYIDFNGMSGVKPEPDTLVLIDYDYYLARKDVVIMDKEGTITVKAGQPEALRAVAAPVHEDPYTLVLGTATILPDSETSRTQKSAMNRLSMADLQKLKSRTDNLEYNMAINALDQPAMQGVNPMMLRGVFSDGFISTSKYDSTHPDAKIAFSFEDAEITLPLNSSTQHKPNIANTGTTGHVWGRLVTAPFTEDRTISQMLASDSMNVNPYNVFNKQATVTLNPSEDTWIDEQRITVTEDTDPTTLDVRRWWGHQTDSWVDSEKQLMETIELDGGADWKDSNSAINGSWRHDGAFTGSRLLAGGQRTIEDMIEFMRQIDVKFHAKNLLPNEDNLRLTFDGVEVNITPDSGFVRGTAIGTIRSNANGEAKGTFTIPAGIRTGIREVTLRNKDNTGTTTFIAQGTNRRVEDVILRQRVTVNMIDPLAQSFQFDSNKVVTSIGLYFASKDPVKNVVVQVRGISEGGTPNKTIYAETVLTPSQIKISADSTQETKVSFEDPLVVDAGREYAVVVITDSDKYTMWIATRGQEDLTGKGTITGNPYLTGVLYSSSNASAWTIHQNSDLKFNVYTANFNETAQLEFDTMRDMSADSIVLMATYLTPQNTGALFEIKLVLANEPDNVTVASKPWMPIANARDIELGNLAREVKLRATFKANRNMSPILSLQDITFTTFLSALRGSYIARTMDMTDAPYNYARVSFDIFTPQGATVTPRYSLDGGKTWKVFTSVPTATQQSSEFTQLIYEEKVVDTGTAKSFKVRLDLASTNSFARPRARRLMVNLRDE